MTDPAPRRPYRSDLRRQRARQTRDRIAAAGCEIARAFPTWDWSGLTATAVAARAGVNKTTVYRHFPTERDLHDAVMRRLEDEAGISYAGMDLTALRDVAGAVFAGVTSVAARPRPAPGTSAPTAGADERRRAALLAALEPATAGWPPQQQRMAAAVVDLLWAGPSHQRLTDTWGLDADQATAALLWGIDVLTAAIREGHQPADEAPVTSPEA